MGPKPGKPAFARSRRFKMRDAWLQALPSFENLLRRVKVPFLLSELVYRNQQPLDAEQAPSSGLWSMRCVSKVPTLRPGCLTTRFQIPSTAPPQAPIPLSSRRNMLLLTICRLAVSKFGLWHCHRVSTCMDYERIWPDVDSLSLVMRYEAKSLRRTLTVQPLSRSSIHLS